MDLDRKYPCVEDMKKGAKQRMPRFVFDYLYGGIDQEHCKARNKRDLNDIHLMPTYGLGYKNKASSPDYSRILWGKQYDAPFGVAPLGLSGLMWHGSEAYLAAAARAHNIPYILSTFGNSSMESIRPIGGDNAWFQFYPPNDREMEDDMIRRAKETGYEVMVVTVDVPVKPRRIRDIRNGLAVPPKIDLKTIMQCATKPTWSLRVLFKGIPEFENMSPYYKAASNMMQSAEFVSSVMDGHITLDRLKHIRDAWPGKLLIKGVLSIEDAKAYLKAGADGLIISNHGGRQFDSAPSAVSVLPGLRSALGKNAVLIADGGIRTGMDIARMMALGADFVLLGRPFMYAVAAMGEAGTDHIMTILKEELSGSMGQLGCSELGDLKNTLLA